MGAIEALDFQKSFQEICRYCTQILSNAVVPWLRSERDAKIDIFPDLLRRNYETQLVEEALWPSYR